MSSAENQKKNVEEPTSTSDEKQEFENGKDREEEDDGQRGDAEDAGEHNGYTKSDFLKIPITVSAPKPEVLNLLFTLYIIRIMLCAHGDKHVHIYHVIFYVKKFYHSIFVVRHFTCLFPF